MFSCDCGSINLRTFSKAVSGMSLVTCLQKTEYLPTVQMSCRVLSRVEVLPFLEGQAGQNTDNCRHRGLRRIAKPSCLRNWGETIRKHASELKGHAKRAEGSPCKGQEVEVVHVEEQPRGELHPHSAF